MRKAGDHRPDDIVKHEILMNEVCRDWWPTVVFDDRSRVVKMWRDVGLLPGSGWRLLTIDDIHP